MITLKKRMRVIVGVVLMSFTAAAAVAAESVEIIRDHWGVPHVFAEDEEALFYGAGFAMAEDRLLQMMLLRAEAEGRLAELLGPGEKDRFVDSDKMYRVLGFHRHARKQLEDLQPDTRRNLEAFAAGVNAYFDANADRLTKFVDLFPRKARPWEAADCLTLWSRHANQFTGGWAGEVKALRKYEQWQTAHGPDEPFPARRLHRDDTAAVISEEEFQRSNPQAYERLKKIAAETVPGVGWLGDPLEVFKASHAWTVSGERSTTGKPILESNPQIPVSFPSLMYEMHLAGGRYDVRGATFIGIPAIFIGWNRHCAWGKTALGGDHADLFQERVDPNDATRYLHGDKSLPFINHSETIAIKGRQPLELSFRETIHGPVANALLDDVQDGEIFAVKHIINASTRSSLEAMLTMMRAHDWESFHKGMKNYVAPSANLVFADDSGNIAYQALVSTPKRRAYESLPKQGWTGEDEWDMVPFEDMPSMLNPDSNTIFSANHLPIGTWYPYLVSTSKGEGPRSYRLRELLAGDEKLSVEDFHQRTHLDPTNPGVRDFVKLATLVIREDGNIDPQLAGAVTTLEGWDGRLVTNVPAYPLARSVLDVLLRETKEETSSFSQFGGEWAQYAGSWNGLNRVLKDLMVEYRETNAAPRDPEVRRWLRTNLMTAIQEARQSGEHRPPITHRMPYQDNIGRWGSLAPQYDQVSPALTCPVTQTIWSQAGETYVQIVDLSDIDNSRALLPPGNSEDPHSRHADDQVSIWVEGKMHPAPLTRAGVQSVKKSVKHLTWPR